MGDPIDDYKKALTPHVDNWGKQNAPLGKQLQDLSKQIDDLEKIKSPSPDQVKKLKELKDKRKAISAKIVQLATNLSNDLLKVPTSPGIDLKLPPPKPLQQNLLQVPGWLDKIVKQKGIPLGDDVTVAPSNISVDLKHMKLKSAGITIKFKF
jgi:hypothetical protein